MNTNTRPSAADIMAKADELVGNRRGWSGGLDMVVTQPADVTAWIPGVISSSFYDRLDTPVLTLTGLAARYNDLEGRPGQTITIPTDTATTPAANLAVDVPATDDGITGSSYSMTIKEAVKSIAWYDRTQVQSGQDVNQLAGRKVGDAVEGRVELDLGAALVAGRNTAKDTFQAAGTGFNLAQLRTMKRAIPARLRRRGLVLVGKVDLLDDLLDDPAVQNAATFGSDEAIRNGDFSRPLAGVTILPVDDATLPSFVVAANPSSPGVVLFARGMLAYGFQKNPSTETERDARARLTRIVGTTLHAEGTLEAAGIVARAFGGR